jgi:hypothetical protein
MARQDDGAGMPLPRRMDTGRLDRLLQMAGPRDGAELLERLAEDLGRIAPALRVACAKGDRAAVRAETHVLLAVAGSIGAAGLEDEARALNRAAHDQDAPLPVGLAQSVLDDLAALRALIARRRANGGAA